MRISLRGKLALFAVLASLVPIVLTAAATYRLAREVLQEKAGYELLRLSLLIKTRTELYVSDRVETLRAIDQDALNGPDAAAALAQFRASRPEFKEILVLNQQGRPVGGVRAPVTMPRNILDPVLRGEMDAVYAQAGPSGALSRALAIALPVGVTRPKTPRRCLYAVLDLGPSLEEIHAYLVGRTGRIAIITDNGRPLIESGGIAAVMPEIIKKVLSGETGFAVAAGPRGDVIVAYAPVLEAASGLRWGLLMSQDRAEALGLAGKLLKRISLVGLVLLLLSATVSLWVARTISRPILKLVQGTEAVASGEFDREIPVASYDEIGTLAEAFNSMSRALKKRDEMIRQYIDDISKKTMALEEAARQRAQFFQFLIHELRSPLSVVINYTQILASSHFVLPAEALKIVKTVLRTGESMLDTVSNLLDLAKVQAGKMPLHLEEFPLADLLDEIREQYLALATPKGLTLTLDTAPAPGLLLFSDRQKLHKILSNLVGNAIKYTREGGVCLMAAAAEGRVTFRIRDTGVGLRAEDLEKLFLEFERIEFNKMAREQVGSGLGLAFTKKLVELLGGTVSVESQYGQGTTFTVVLPARASTPGSAETESAVAAQAAVAGSGGTPGRIVVIDDDAAMLELIKTLLEGEGYTIFTAQVPAEGIALVREKQPFVVLLDMNLGDTDGIAVLKELKSVPATMKIPVIFVTGTSNAKAFQYFPGIVDCFPKPLPTAQLLARLDSLSHLAKPFATILVLDPDAEVEAEAAAAIIRNLQRSGFRVLKALDAEEGLRILRESRPQWLFLTAKIGARTCFDILSSIRSAPDLKDIKVVLLSPEKLSAEDLAQMERQVLRVVPSSAQEALANLNEFKEYLLTLYR